MYAYFTGNNPDGNKEYIDESISLGGLVEQDLISESSKLLGASGVFPENFINVFEYDDGDYILRGNVIYDLLNCLMARYSKQYFLAVYSDEELEKEMKHIITQLLSYMNLSAPRYVKLLEIYSNSADKLLDRLQSVVGGSASTEGTSRFNDTPQTHPSTFDEFADPDYTTDITISNSASESEQTTEWDDTNIMKRIAEIQESYQNLMQRWIGEFDKFFWEE